MHVRALAFVLVASAVQTGRAEPCAPRAELAGDAEAVASVAAELERLGVEATTATFAPDRCPVIVAAVELDASGGIAVAVRDASKRSEGRVVSDASLAAAWIDSWLRDDFVASAGVPPSEVPVAEPAPASPPPSDTPPHAPALERFSLAASYVSTWSDDSTSWSGFAASGCVHAGGLCVGGRLAYASQQVSTDASAAAKRDLSLLATASYSQNLGRMSFAPELGLGVGRLSTERVEGCKPVPTDMMCEPADPMCFDPTVKCESTLVYVGDGLQATTYTPRISAAVRVAVPLFDHVWLDGLAAATIAPFGHSESYGAAAPTVMVPNGSSPFPLPGDPMFGLQLGIGLRLGAR